MPFKTKEQKQEWARKYYQKNKDEAREKLKEYRKTPEGRKVYMKSLWKQRGVIFEEDFEKVYERYENTTECDVCKSSFTETNRKCLDHEHTTGLFRQILCNNCNVKDNWEKKV